MTTPHKAYAVRFVGAFWLVHAPTHARAKGLVLRLAFEADPQYRHHMAGLQCRRWPQFDGWLGERAQYWGYPGERSIDTGGLPTETPAPFAGAQP